MVILPIKKYPDPILRKKSKKIKLISEEIKNLARNMIETMTESGGIGLAAPQIGELKRIIIIQAKKGPQEFINPKIIKKSKETEIGEEGCLSFPGLYLEIRRAEEVEFKALNLKGEEVQIKTRSLPARIFQHEIDHLDGILFIDKINFWQKLKIKNKLNKIAKQYGSY